MRGNEALGNWKIHEGDRIIVPAPIGFLSPQDGFGRAHRRGALPKDSHFPGIVQFVRSRYRLSRPFPAENSDAGNSNPLADSGIPVAAIAPCTRASRGN